MAFANPGLTGVRRYADFQANDDGNTLFWYDKRVKDSFVCEPWTPITYAIELVLTIMIKLTISIVDGKIVFAFSPPICFFNLFVASSGEWMMWDISPLTAQPSPPFEGSIVGAHVPRLLQESVGKWLRSSSAEDIPAYPPVSSAVYGQPPAGYYEAAEPLPPQDWREVLRSGRYSQPGRYWQVLRRSLTRLPQAGLLEPERRAVA